MKNINVAKNLEYFKTIKKGLTHNQIKSCIKMLNMRYTPSICKKI